MGAGVILEVCALETVLWSETEGKEETEGGDEETQDCAQLAVILGTTA